MIATNLICHFSAPGTNPNTDRPILQLVYQPARDGSYPASRPSRPWSAASGAPIKYGDGVIPD